MKKVAYDTLVRKILKGRYPIARSLKDHGFPEDLCFAANVALKEELQEVAELIYRDVLEKIVPTTQPLEDQVEAIRLQLRNLSDRLGDL